MNNDTFHLAQINIALPKAEMDSAIMADFSNALDAVNAFAEASPGFIWRLKDEDGADATGFDPYGDGRLINVSVWQNLESLKAFVYKTGHASFIRRRAEWFDKMQEAHMALWWIKADDRPTIEAAVAKLAILNEKGPTRQAFSFAQAFEAT